MRSLPRARCLRPTLRPDVDQRPTRCESEDCYRQLVRIAGEAIIVMKRRHRDGAGNGTVVNHAVYGRIPGRRNAHLGSYDSIVVTPTF